MNDNQPLFNPEINRLSAAIIEKIMILYNNYQYKPEEFIMFCQQWLGISIDSLNIVNFLLKYQSEVKELHVTYFQKVFELCQQQYQLISIKYKKKVKNHWLNYFNFLLEFYTLTKNYFLNLGTRLNIEDKNQLKKFNFFFQQYFDTISPEHLLNNQELFFLTINTNGLNLLRGLKNLLDDIEIGSNRLLISMTDKKAFKVGENLATTPGKVIFRNSLIELIQYKPQTSQVKSIPLLIIPPWINKYYILDLSPHNSFTSYLVQKGITVFIISWVNPDHSYANKSLTDYLLEGPITAIEIIFRQLNINKVNALGFCIGGTLLAILLSYYKAKSITNINCSTFLTSLIDFSDPGDLGAYINEKQIEQIETHMRSKGYLSGSVMSLTFNSLRSKDLIWNVFMKNYLHGKNPKPFDFLYWNMDSTNMPAKMHSQYLRWMYLENNLVTANKIIINGVKLNVHEIEVPAFFIATKNDHIAPWKTIYNGFKCFKGKKHFLLGGSGHIAGIVNPPGSDKYGFYSNDNYPDNPDTWFANTQYRTGSWWPEWFQWLNNQSGDQIPAPNFKKLLLKPLVAAPGRYVHNFIP